MENIFRIIGYALLFMVNAITYWFLHSHFNFMVMVVMIVLPIISIAMALHMRSRLTGEVWCKCAKGEYGKQGEEIYFLLKFNNPTWWVSLDMKVDVEVSNSFFGTKGDMRFSIPLHSKKGYQIELPLLAHLPGLVNVEIKDVIIKDLMGFVYLKKSINTSGEGIIMPRVFEGGDYDKNSLESGMLESEESTKRGNDFSDVQEIREYIPGDKLMSIHWKLSAKRDILMVKDRVSMSDRQLVVLPELCNQTVYDLNIVLATTYSLISKLLEDKLTVRLMYWSKNRYEYEEIRIDYLSTLNEAFSKMFYESCDEDMDEAASHMSMVHPEMKSYLQITSSGGQAIVRVRENG